MLRSLTASALLASLCLCGRASVGSESIFKSWDDAVKNSNKNNSAKTPIRTGLISSDPPGATIYFHNEWAGFQPENEYSKNRMLGKTPSTVNYKSPEKSFSSKEAWLLIELTGYETEYWQFPKDGSIKKHFVLIKDISVQIKEDGVPNDKEYLKRIIDVVGECDKFLKSPLLTAGISASNAQKEYEKLQIDFPKYKDKRLDFYVGLLVAKCSDALKYSRPDPIDIGQIDNLIKKIKSAIL